MAVIKPTLMLGALLALATASSAGGLEGKATKFQGSLPGGGNVSLRLGASANPNVSKISIKGIGAECRRGSATLDYAISGGTPLLADRSFVVRSLDGTGGKAKVKGRFSRKFKRVEGKVRVHGRFFDGKARCDSGKQKYVGR
jgi:hypothetical protein